MECFSDFAHFAAVYFSAGIVFGFLVCNLMSLGEPEVQQGVRVETDLTLDAPDSAESDAESDVDPEESIQEEMTKEELDFDNDINKLLFNLTSKTLSGNLEASDLGQVLNLMGQVSGESPEVIEIQSQLNKIVKSKKLN